MIYTIETEYFWQLCEQKSFIISHFGIPKPFITYHNDISYPFNNFSSQLFIWSSYTNKMVRCISLLSKWYWPYHCL